MRIVITSIVGASCLLGGARAGAADVPEGYTLVFEESFEDPQSIEAFCFSDPAAWRLARGADGNGRLELAASSAYRPLHRSPHSIAIIADCRVRDFVLEADLLQTGRDYGHRDLCVFFGVADPTHFYYAHLATQADEHAHNVFVVNDAPRKAIGAPRTAGVDWGRDEWHRVRVERSAGEGSLRVYFDDMSEPVLEAADRTFEWGFVGFGSFDDIGLVDNVRLWAPEARAANGGFFTRGEGDVWSIAARNGEQAREALVRSARFVEGWLAHADPVTGLIPRNLGQGRDMWNAADAAADNYPFMVLTAALTDRSLFEGRMREMLETETRLTSRVDRIPDDYSFSRRGFRHDEPDLNRLIFGGSEYVKDGLLPLTEWIGESPWSNRMLGIIDDIWKHAPVDTARGPIPSTNVEVNGEMLQALSRVFWMTGDDGYLDRAVRLGDFYLLGEAHPTRDFDVLRLRDHGCEIVSGLVELYVACRFARPEVAEAYRAPIHEMLDRILEVGVTEHGMMYNSIAPAAGTVRETALADTWGYNGNAFYAVYLVDGVERYREMVVRALGHLDLHYRNHRWEGESADGYADSIEGAINLLAREPVPSARRWIDSEIEVMFAKQRSDGVIEGWHGDGNFARTAIMYALMKTQGASLEPWRADVRLGGVVREGTLHLALDADQPWQGALRFDRPRHRDVMKLPLDYPRINQFPEWFAIEADGRYEVSLGDGPVRIVSGETLIGGFETELVDPGGLRLTVRRADAEPE